MLLSMTGFGHSSSDDGGVHVSTEIKSVNNRYLKLSVRMPDTVARFEADIEKLIRSRVTRGSVQLSIRVRFVGGQSEHRIDGDLLRGYQDQLKALSSGDESPRIESLLTLPGVVVETEFSDEILNSLWPVLEKSLSESLDHFEDFRRREGESMRLDLDRQCEVIETEVTKVATLAPIVVNEYRDKILERVRRLINDASITISENDVIREVALFADRCDINEEITRLRSHTEQFRRLLNGETSQGRKLEFIGQEMFREINTIGSKANHVTIALGVVEMKAAIERMREVLQNVE
ncbi:MAG: YicC family protein [Planctomycetaceae bacterium]|nr:YicC family protein [Planctomycetaceae bacterium]